MIPAMTENQTTQTTYHPDPASAYCAAVVGAVNGNAQHLAGFAIRDPYTMRLWWPDAATDPITDGGAEK